MRNIGEIDPEDHLDPLSFSHLLKKNGIHHHFEEIQEGGRFKVRFWIHEEDDVGKAEALFEKFQKNPENYPSESSPSHEEYEPIAKVENKASPLFRAKGPISIALIAIMILIFIFSPSTKERIPPKIPGIESAPLFSNLEKKLLYDYPHYFELRDELLKKYSKEELESKERDERAIEKIKKVPYWNGIYDRVVNHIRDKSSPLKYEGPLFEKIRTGEVWRTFTPVILHYDFIHIFFNVLWFIILSNQIEFRLGALRYTLFLLISAITSNTAQYLMSGSFFLGISGIVCAMAGFIWARQTVAPWEGYLLNRLTLIFLLAFVFGIFGIQVMFFFFETLGKVKLQIPIANTAHIVGGVVGYLMGRLKFFSLRTRR